MSTDKSIGNVYLEKVASIYKALFDDVQLAKKFVEAHDHQYFRRSYFRALFALVHLIVCTLKEATVHFADIKSSNLTQDEILFLEGSNPSFLPYKSNGLKLTHAERAFAWVSANVLAGLMHIMVSILETAQEAADDSEKTEAFKDWLGDLNQIRRHPDLTNQKHVKAVHESWLKASIRLGFICPDSGRLLIDL